MEITHKDRVALVTGASRGIGRAIAEELARGGATVICVSRSADSCGAAAEAIQAAGGKAEAHACDVGEPAAIKAAAEELLGRHERLDILVNNAGITRDNLLMRMSDEEWDSVQQTNLASCFHWSRALMRPMTRARWGRILNISSVVGIMGNAGQTNYAAAKAGMIGFTKALARELAARQVTVNAVAPGFIETDMTATLGDEVKEQAVKAIPLKRFGAAADVASLTAFLASDASGYITGQTFTVDGGMAM